MSTIPCKKTENQEIRQREKRQDRKPQVFLRYKHIKNNDDHRIIIIMFQCIIDFFFLTSITTKSLVCMALGNLLASEL